MTNLTIISNGNLKTPTIAKPHPGGAVAVHQGRDYVTLSADELARLVAVATGHTSSAARTRAKARLMRYPIRPRKQTPEDAMSPALA
jgi:hypothetical protein